MISAVTLCCVEYYGCL